MSEMGGARFLTWRLLFDKVTTVNRNFKIKGMMKDGANIIVRRPTLFILDKYSVVLRLPVKGIE